MAQSFTVQLDVGSHCIENVVLHCGLALSGDMRSSFPSSGTDIEVPAVIELLNLIVAGEITAEQVRDELNRLTSAINELVDREREKVIELMEQPDPRVVRKKIRFDDRWVYAISTDDSPGSIKIGVAKDIAQRMKSLQAGSAAKLELRWSARGGFPLEGHLHEHFDAMRTHGEWFDFQGRPDPVQEINEAAGPFLQQYDREVSINS